MSEIKRVPHREMLIRIAKEAGLDLDDSDLAVVWIRGIQFEFNHEGALIDIYEV